MTAGTLFVVATPIGNLKDITLRAIETLAGASNLVAEDTRRTRGLLEHLGIRGKRLVSIHRDSSPAEVARLAERLGCGENVAFVTDAGTPAVSDPGSLLVAAAIRVGARVVAIPGPSAVLAALVTSGLSSDAGFRFMAFLPRDGAKRRAAIAEVAKTADPVVVFESPVRLAATLRDLADAMPDRAACVARELTKVHEETVRGSLAELAESPREWRGEAAIVLGVWSVPEGENVGQSAIDARIRDELSRGSHAKDVAERVSAWSGKPRREIYARVVALKAAPRA